MESFLEELVVAYGMGELPILNPNNKVINYLIN